MDTEFNKILIGELNGTNITNQRKSVQPFEFSSFKNVLDKLILNAQNALNTNDYLELMKIAVSIKTKAKMLKNTTIPDDIKKLLDLADKLEKEARERKF